MKIYKSLIIRIAHLIKYINPPHLIKYIFFLIIKNKNIPIKSKLKISNIPLLLNLGDFIEYWIFIDGSYEGAWIEYIKKYIINKTFIDVGANIGVYSLSLFKHAKHIYSFEPELNNINTLKSQIAMNNIQNIIPINKAVYSKDNLKKKLFVSNQDKGWHSLSIKFPGGEQAIKTITLDTFIKEKEIRSIGLIKIDVEGAEFDVLQGMSTILRELHPPILIEFNQPRAKLAGHSTNVLYAILKKSNYDGYILREGKLKKVKIGEVDKIYNENVLFLFKK